MNNTLKPKSQICTTLLPRVQGALVQLQSSPNATRPGPISFAAPPALNKGPAGRAHRRAKVGRKEGTLGPGPCSGRGEERGSKHTSGASRGCAQLVERTQGAGPHWEGLARLCMERSRAVALRPGSALGPAPRPGEG